MTREELITSKEYHIATIECDIEDLCATTSEFTLTEKELEKITIKKLVDIAISCGYIPIITYMKINDYVNADKLK